jgi:glucosamine 6-phosphate synthetase-like amidotransferase/phosphosugar isomerase protein
MFSCFLIFKIIEAIGHLPDQISRVLVSQGPKAEQLAAKLKDERSLLVMGRYK